MKNSLLIGAILLAPILTACEPVDPIESSGTSGTTGSVQCRAITQKGTRCKRMVADGGYYCWQHR